MEVSEESIDNIIKARLAKVTGEKMAELIPVIIRLTVQEIMGAVDDDGEEEST